MNKKIITSDIFDKNILLKDKNAQEKQEIINSLLKQIEEEGQKNGYN